MGVNSNYRISLLSQLEPSLRASMKSEIEEMVVDARNRGEAWVGSWTASSIRTEVEQGSTLLALSQDGQHLMAFLCFRPPGSVWEIMLVATLRQFRGQKLAGTLIDALFEHVEEFHAAGGAPHDVDSQEIEVGLEVSAINLSALSCYRNCGFIEQRRRKGYYSSSVSGPSDAILMSAKRPRSSGPKAKQ